MTTLDKYLKSIDIRLSPAARIIRAQESESFSVASTSKISLHAVVASAPKNSTLSPRTSSLAAHYDSFPTQVATPTLRLATCVLYELLIGEHSRWSVYLEHLPKDMSTVAAIWHPDSHLSSWAAGTELEREINRLGLSHTVATPSSHSVAAFQATLSIIYTNHVLPFVSRLLPISAAPPTFPLFLRSFAHVTSRAFLIDNFHHLALVPLFDLFNHSTDSPHVHLESHEWVCIVCGHWDWCEHEQNDESSEGKVGPPEDTTLITEEADEDERVELVAHCDIAPGFEIHNTYGEALSNARLLLEYGFIVEANPWDVSTFDSAAFLSTFFDFLDEVAEVRQLVVAKAGDDAPLSASEGREGGDFFFDADAKVSVGLWCALIWQHRGTSSRGTWLRLAKLQDRHWDDAQESDESLAKEGAVSDSDREIFLLVSRDIVALSRTRRLDPRVHRADLSPAEILTLADVNASDCCAWSKGGMFSNGTLAGSIAFDALGFRDFMLPVRQDELGLEIVAGELAIAIGWNFLRKAKLVCITALGRAGVKAEVISTRPDDTVPSKT
ncbi:hypothetical protein P7C70_g234, partial [Phenoliferia sp. Uapishka_3]